MICISGRRYSWHIRTTTQGRLHTLTRRHRGTSASISWVAAVYDPDPRKRTLSFLKAQIREAARQIDRRIYVEASKTAEVSEAL